MDNIFTLTTLGCELEKSYTLIGIFANFNDAVERANYFEKDIVDNKLKGSYEISEWIVGKGIIHTWIKNACDKDFKLYEAQENFLKSFKNIK